MGCGARDAARGRRFETAIERTDLRDPELGEAKQRLAALEATLGVLDVRAPAGGKFSVAHVESAEIPRRTHLSAGDYTVSVATANGEVTRAIHITLGETTALVFDIPASSARVTLPAVPKSNDARKTHHTRRTLAFASLGVAGLASVGAIVLGVNALEARDTFRADPTSQGALDHAKDLRLATNLTWAGAAAFGALGIVLFATSSSSGAEPASALRGPASVKLSAGLAHLRLSGAF